MKIIKTQFNKKGQLELKIISKTINFISEREIRNKNLSVIHNFDKVDSKILVNYKKEYEEDPKFIFYIDTSELQGKRTIYKINGELYIFASSPFEVVTNYNWRLELFKPLLEQLNTALFKKDPIKKTVRSNLYSIEAYLTEILKDYKRDSVYILKEADSKMDFFKKKPNRFVSQTIKDNWFNNKNIIIKKPFDEVEYNKLITEEFNFHSLLFEGIFDEWFVKNYTNELTFPVLKLYFKLLGTAAYANLRYIDYFDTLWSALYNMNQYNDEVKIKKIIEKLIKNYPNKRNEIENFQDNELNTPKQSLNSILEYNSLKTKFTDFLSNFRLVY